MQEAKDVFYWKEVQKGENVRGNSDRWSEMWLRIYEMRG